MKSILLVTAISAVLSLNACDKDHDKGTREENVGLGKCQSEDLGNDKVSLCYDKLVEDSRCPKDVVCVRGGPAVGQFTFTVNAEKHILTLATGKTGTYSTDTTIGRYHIELQDIAPFPRDRQPQSAGATLLITRQ